MIIEVTYSTLYLDLSSTSSTSTYYGGSYFFPFWWICLRFVRFWVRDTCISVETNGRNEWEILLYLAPCLRIRVVVGIWEISYFCTTAKNLPFVRPLKIFQEFRYKLFYIIYLSKINSENKSTEPYNILYQL